jgi:hypothetical protein
VHAPHCGRYTLYVTFQLRSGTSPFSKIFSCVIKRKCSHWQERLRHVSVPFRRRRRARMFDMTVFFYIISWTARFSGEKMIEHKMCVLACCTTSNYRKNSARYDHKCLVVFMYSTCFSCHIIIKLQLSIQIFKKIPNMKLMKIGPREPSCSIRTDKRDEPNSGFSQICEPA